MLHVVQLFHFCFWLKLRRKGCATWLARSSERSSAYRETLCEQKAAAPVGVGVFAIGGCSGKRSCLDCSRFAGAFRPAERGVSLGPRAVLVVHGTAAV